MTMKKITFHDRYGNDTAIDAALIPQSPELKKACEELADYQSRMGKLGPKAEAILTKGASGGDVEKLVPALTAVRCEEELIQRRIKQLKSNLVAELCACVLNGADNARNALEKATTAKREAVGGAKSQAAAEFGKRAAERLRLAGLESIDVRKATSDYRTALAVAGAFEALRFQIDEAYWLEWRKHFNPGPADRIRIPDFNENCAKVLEQLAA